jgi:hypothetical protein
MPSTTIPESTQQDLEGRSVRDVVTYSPGQVNDAWCRKVLHKILRSLDLQYAMQMPHRAITPDTVVFHANGEPLLISDDIDAPPAPDSQLADDLTALAGVIHYAITHELAPAGPLARRADGYSAALVAMVDACMDPDPARRPHSIDAVRALVDIAAPGPLVAVGMAAGMAAGVPEPDTAASPLPPVPSHVPAAPPAASAIPPAVAPAPVDRPAPDAAVEAQHAGVRRGWRWPYAAGGAAIAAALALVLFVNLRDGGADNHTALTQVQPQAGDRARPGTPAQAGAASTDSGAVAAQEERVAVGAPGVPAGAAATVRPPEPAGSAAGGAAENAARDLTADTAGNPPGSAASGASSGGTTGSGGGVEQPEETTRATSNPVAAAGNIKATTPPALPARVAAAKTAKGGATAGPGAVPGKAIYQLHIKPWGVVYVDGVERGASPPMKRLVLTPGPHTIRIANPKYRDSILEFESAQTTSNGNIIVDFDREAQ